MNKEVEKAINNKQKKIAKANKKNANIWKNISTWWDKNDYKVYRVIFFYIWLAMCLAEKIEKKLNSRNRWSDERADEILNYYIPRRAEWDDEEKEFFLFDNGYGWNIGRAKKYLKLKDRRFWKVNCNHSGSDLCDYLAKEFELEGFVKEVADYSWGSMEIIFKMK